MESKKFLLSDLRKTINADSRHLLSIIQNIPYSEETRGAKMELLKFVDVLHQRWNDLYEMENGKF